MQYASYIVRPLLTSALIQQRLPHSVGHQRNRKLGKILVASQRAGSFQRNVLLIISRGQQPAVCGHCNFEV